jgi:hypothetical protein
MIFSRFDGGSSFTTLPLRGFCSVRDSLIHVLPVWPIRILCGQTVQNGNYVVFCHAIRTGLALLSQRLEVKLRLIHQLLLAEMATTVLRKSTAAGSFGGLNAELG